jgi:hypothetical protein
MRATIEARAGEPLGSTEPALAEADRQCPRADDQFAAPKMRRMTD